MSKFRDAKTQCSLLVRSWVHLARSGDFFSRYLEVGADLTLQAALFSSAVTQYGIPFGPSRTRSGAAVKLTPDDLKAAGPFDAGLHEHLMLVRNKLVAHDDLGFIEARIMVLSTSHTIDQEQYSVIEKIMLSTKVLDIPIGEALVRKMLAHTQACAKACEDLAFDAMDKYHDLIVDDWTGFAMQRELYEEHPTKSTDGKKLPLPDITQHPYLEPETPNSLVQHGGYRYSRFNLAQDREPPFPVRRKNGDLIGLLKSD